MTSRDFCFWLQGVFEVGGAKKFDEPQTEMIRRHLDLVFKHEIDPSMGDAEHQAKLDALHTPTVLKVDPTKTPQSSPPPWAPRPPSDVTMRC